MRNTERRSPDSKYPRIFLTYCACCWFNPNTPPDLRPLGPTRPTTSKAICLGPCPRANPSDSAARVASRASSVIWVIRPPSHSLSALTASGLPTFQRTTARVSPGGSNLTPATNAVPLSASASASSLRTVDNTDSSRPIASSAPSISPRSSCSITRRNTTLLRSSLIASAKARDTLAPYLRSISLSVRSIVAKASPC